MRRDSNRDTFTIGSKALKLSLLKVVPGSELSVSKHLGEAVYNKTGSTPHFQLKLFGNYDIACLYESDDFSPKVARAGAIDHILSSNQIHAFVWQPSEQRSKPAVFYGNGSVWGLLLFKMDEFQVGRSRIEIEQ